MGWSVRFFIPEQKKEYKVFMLAKYDDPWYPHFYETLSDTAFLPFLSKSDALTLVKEFANNTKIDLSNMILIKELLMQVYKQVWDACLNVTFV